MTVTFDLPDAIEKHLRAAMGDLDAAAKEAALVELYRQVKLTHHQLATALGLDRLETDALLNRHGVSEDLVTPAEFDEQLAGLRRRFGRMIVVSDTTPLNYLILIGQDHILPALFGQVVAPPAVVAELRRSKAPSAVSAWANNLPAWLEVRTPTTVPAVSDLGPGETEALALAQELQADVLLIDERDGVAAAKRLNLFVTGTLGVLVLAAEKGLLSLPSAIAALRGTTFRGPQKLIDELLRADAQRRAEETPDGD